MKNLSAKTLFYPFDQRTLPVPDEGKKCLFVCPPQGFSHVGFKLDTDVLTYDKTVADSYELAGHEVYQKFEKIAYYDGVFICAPKQKEELYFLISNALRSLIDGGLIIVAAMNDAGGKRLEKILNDFGLQTSHETKNKARVVWAYKKDIADDVIEKYILNGTMQQYNINDIPTITQSGIYGWNKVDTGSKLLVESLPVLKGKGADFGCGYGYLSREVLNKNPDIKALYAIDNDWRSVQATQENCPSAHALWHDLRTKPKNMPWLDWVVMNPPFHDGKNLNIDLGQSMIKIASQSLTKNGKLYMVANAHLPYESILSDNFFEVHRSVQAKGFKVFEAKR